MNPSTIDDILKPATLSTVWTYWFGTMPPIIKLCLDSIAEHNPDTRLVTDKTFQQIGPEATKAFNIANGRSASTKADLFRLFLLAKFGGQWLDSDCIALRPLDMHQYLKDGINLVGYSNGAPKHFSNNVLAAKPNSPGIVLAYTQALDTLTKLPSYQQLPYGTIGQGILGNLHRKQSAGILRLEHWRYNQIHFSKSHQFLQTAHDPSHCIKAIYNKNACCYHLTNKIVDKLKHLTEDQLLKHRSFTGFLLRRSFGKVTPLRSRSILNYIPKHEPIIGVEVGVKRGTNAINLLQQRPNLSMHLVDLWAEHPKDGTYRKSKDANASIKQEGWNKIYSSLNRQIAFARPRVQIHRKDSLEAIIGVPEVDFVFIDGDHSYEGCRRDIEAWASKIKPGGWIGGHDYDHAREKNGDWGVKKAVDEFANRLNLTIELGQDQTWFIRLPT